MGHLTGGWGASKTRAFAGEFPCEMEAPVVGKPPPVGPAYWGRGGQHFLA